MPSVRKTHEQDTASGSKQGSSNGKSPSVASGLSGAVAGAVIGACIQPLDVIRTTMQGDSGKGVMRGTVATMQEIVSSKGVRGLWQGTGPSVIRIGLGVGVHMVLLENMKSALLRHMVDGPPYLSSMSAAIVGGLSRAIATTIEAPMTVVKTRMEYSSKDMAKYRNTMHALATIVRTEGAAALFKGLVPTILSTAPFSGLYYMFYTRLKEHLAVEGRPQVIVNLSSGTLAAVAATFMTQPFDVIRTHMQLHSRNAAGLSAWASVRQLIKTQGPAVLVVGVVPRVLKRTTQTALVWTVYEELVPQLTALCTWVVAYKHRQQQQQQQQHPSLEQQAQQPRNDDK